MRTSTLERIVTKIAKHRGYIIRKNKRFVLYRSPKLCYQPDFLLVGRKGKIVVEIELTTADPKSVLGDVIRAGLAKADLFVGITEEKFRRTIEEWGELVSRKFFPNLKVIAIAAKTKKDFELGLERVL